MRPGDPRFLPAGLALLCALLLALPLAAKKKEVAPVRPQPADTYAAHDSHDGITIAAEPYDQTEKSKAVFGKYDPLKFGFLPVFVVITNNSKDALRLDNLELQFITGRRQRLEPTPAGAVSLRVQGRKAPPGRVGTPGSPLPIPRLPRGYDPHAVGELVDREFVLKMVPAGETVGGFFFFQVGFEHDVLAGAGLYLPGITWARTGRPLMYFEVSFDDYLKGK